jgi:ABC-type multidrug transport system fused ATPase/permease subunit
MFDPVRKLSKVSIRFPRAEAGAERIFELRDHPPQKPGGRDELPRHRESIAFREVRFRYPAASEEALRGIDLDIPAGQTLAIVGPNGCGKTTLVSLLPRLIDPTGGAVYIDGRDIAECSLPSLRRQIALVPQEAVVFKATIAENVAYGKPGATEGEVASAGRRAFVEEFVRELPDGYGTLVGEHGATLSGGQRQRIAIARAIVRDPAILIFDEALSQIDPDSERKIHAALSDFMADRTALVIAHRFATVLAADRIAVMEAGRIVDVGGHDELLARCPLYGQLYRNDFGPRQKQL